MCYGVYCTFVLNAKDILLCKNKIFTYQHSALEWFVQLCASHGFAKHGVRGTPGKHLLLIGHRNPTGKILAIGS